MEDSLEYLQGQIDALTKLCLTFAALHNPAVMTQYLETLAGDPRNTALSAERIRGIETVLVQLQTVRGIRELAAKGMPPKPGSKGH